MNQPTSTYVYYATNQQVTAANGVLLGYAFNASIYVRAGYYMDRIIGGYGIWVYYRNYVAGFSTMDIIAIMHILGMERVSITNIFGFLVENHG